MAGALDSGAGASVLAQAPSARVNAARAKIFWNVCMTGEVCRKKRPLSRIQTHLIVACLLDRPARLNFATTPARMFLHARCLQATPFPGVFAFVAACAVMLGPVSRAFADEVEATLPTENARPEPLAPLVPKALPETRHVDVGVAAALLYRVADGQTASPLARYPVTIGWGLSARVSVWRYLRANLYAVHGSSSIDMPDGALGLPGNPGTMALTSYSFGLRLSPTLPLGTRARAWFTAGAGWGRVETGRFDVTSDKGTFRVRERAFSFVEIPIGIGTSFDIIKNWLSVEFEVTGAFHASQRGTALRDGQTIDAEGHRTKVGPFPALSASFVQTLGLALVL